MNIKKIILALVLIYSVFFYSGINAKEIVITCEYDKFLYVPGENSVADLYAKLKIVVYDDDTTTFYDNGSAVELSYSGTNIDLYQGAKKYSTMQFYMDKSEKKNFVEGYKKDKVCPTVTSVINQGMSFKGSDLGYFPDIMYYPSKPSKTTYPEGVKAPTDGVKLKKECVYSVPSSTFSSVTGFDIVFQMYTDGKKKMCTRAKSGLMENCAPVDYYSDEGYAGTVITTDPKSNRSYNISLKGKEIPKIYIQGNFAMVEHNEFNCPPKDSLIFVETSFSLGMYYITTDAEEAKEWGKSHTGKLNEGSLAENGEADKTNNRTITANNSNVDSNINITDINCGFISGDLKDWLVGLLNLIRIGGLVLTLIFGMLDFTKATLSSDKDALKNTRSLWQRLIAVVLLFIVPAIISLILGLSGIPIFTNDPFCGL